MATISEQLAAGLTHHRAGRLQAAEEAYRSILEAAPDQADAWHLLGAVACQAGRLDEAVERLRRAIELGPDVGVFHNSLGNALRLQGKLDAAVACYRRAVECQPDLAEAHQNLGQSLSMQGRFREAAESFRAGPATATQRSRSAGMPAERRLERDRVDPASAGAFACRRRFARPGSRAGGSGRTLSRDWRRDTIW